MVKVLNPFLAIVVSVALGLPLRCQRETPAPRSGIPSGDHIDYKAHQFRGGNLWLTRSLGPTNLWNRYPDNRLAIETNLAHAASKGVNVMRLFLDYRAFLWSRFFEAGSGANTYANKVRAVCDLADQYEIGLIPVFFNPVGFSVGG